MSGQAYAKLPATACLVALHSYAPVPRGGLRLSVDQIGLTWAVSLVFYMLIGPTILTTGTHTARLDADP